MTSYGRLSAPDYDTSMDVPVDDRNLAAARIQRQWRVHKRVTVSKGQSEDDHDLEAPEAYLDSSGIENTPRKRWGRLVNHTKKIRDLDRKEEPQTNLNRAVQTASSPQQKELEAEHWLELIDG
ncbi:hypothetical protein BDN72DRAFT_890950 [Pluteus cervinus]|uniref:Uncharacterized protein n=1 Tax=Pluteus cervinus TaxID=181527 RepID=A0ACD3BH76_9AGAR|nr:hypothetical protein BDN72DRAFT_890950 [Pluteus cervinus]